MVKVKAGKSIQRPHPKPSNERVQMMAAIRRNVKRTSLAISPPKLIVAPERQSWSISSSIRRGFENFGYKHTTIWNVRRIKENVSCAKSLVWGGLANNFLIRPKNLSWKPKPLEVPLICTKMGSQHRANAPGSVVLLNQTEHRIRTSELSRISIVYICE